MGGRRMEVGAWARRGVRRWVGSAELCRMSTGTQADGAWGLVPKPCTFRIVTV